MGYILFCILLILFGLFVLGVYGFFTYIEGLIEYLDRNRRK